MSPSQRSGLALRTAWWASSMSGVLYISRISSFDQSYLGVRALTAFHSALLPSGGGGGVAEIGEKASLTGVLNDRVHAEDEACRERTAARLGRRVSAIVVRVKVCCCW